MPTLSSRQSWHHDNSWVSAGDCAASNQILWYCQWAQVPVHNYFRWHTNLRIPCLSKKVSDTMSRRCCFYCSFCDQVVSEMDYNIPRHYQFKHSSCSDSRQRSFSVIWSLYLPKVCSVITIGDQPTTCSAKLSLIATDLAVQKDYCELLTLSFLVMFMVTKFILRHRLYW